MSHSKGVRFILSLRKYIIYVVIGLTTVTAVRYIHTSLVQNAVTINNLTSELDGMKDMLQQYLEREERRTEAIIRLQEADHGRSEAFSEFTKALDQLADKEPEIYDIFNVVIPDICFDGLRSIVNCDTSTAHSGANGVLDPVAVP